MKHPQGIAGTGTGWKLLPNESTSISCPVSCSLVKHDYENFVIISIISTIDGEYKHIYRWKIIDKSSDICYSICVGDTDRPS
jgi:hypothetical protein